MPNDVVSATSKTYAWAVTFLTEMGDLPLMGVTGGRLRHRKNGYDCR